VWRISIENEGPKVILEKGLTENVRARDWGQMESTKSLPTGRQAGTNNQTMIKISMTEIPNTIRLISVFGH